MKRLDFSMNYNYKWFTIEFESASESENRILSISFEGFKEFKLDMQWLELRHQQLIKEANKKMQIVAQDAWVSDIPTLAYYRKEKPIKMFLYSIIFIFLLLSSSPSFCQAFVDVGGGIAQIKKDAKVSSCVIPMMKISAGYQFSNVVVEWIIQPSLSRIANTPTYLGAKIGYNIHGFIPSIGAFYDYRNADDVGMNKGEIGYALKYQMPLNENGGLFAEAMYTNSSYSLTAGFHVQF